MRTIDELPPLPPSTVTFDRPPVTEVAFAVQWAEPVTDETLTLGRFWPKIQARYPHLEPQAPLPPMAEQFGASAPVAISFEIFDRPPSGRYWLLNEDRTELVQVQPDRFAYNWRKEPPDATTAAEYPRYEHLRERFFELYVEFVRTCHEYGRDTVPTWCELTYVNPIEVESDDGWPDLSTVLARLRPVELQGLGRPEDTTLNERYLLTRGEKPYGRFYATAAPARRVKDNAPLVMLTLVARGMAASPDTAGVIQLLDEGRDLIVNGFRDMTTDEMHERWGLHDAS